MHLDHQEQRSVGTCSEHARSEHVRNTFIRSCVRFVRSFVASGRTGGAPGPPDSPWRRLHRSDPPRQPKKNSADKKKLAEKKIGRTNVGRFFFWSKN